MPPTRRRARAAAGAALSTSANGPAGRGGAAGGGAGGNNANDSDDDSGPTFNIVEVALKYGEDHEAKTKGRANKLLTESKRLATVYTGKVNEVLRVQDEEITTLWESYSQATVKDEAERKEISDALAENLLEIEKLRGGLEQTAVSLAKGRLASVSKHLDADEAKLTASHKRLVKSVRGKRSVFSSSSRNLRQSADSLQASRKQ